ncbi:membrane anchor subunit of succinate dehydrogenase [Umbelopsis nana]
MSLLAAIRIAPHLRQKSAYAPMFIRAYGATPPRFQETAAKAADSAKTESAESTSEAKEGKKEVVSKYVPPNYVDGSFHWSYERATAAALIPLFTTQFVYGAHPVLDGVLGLVLPLHLHIGFNACVTDYFPARKFPRANKYLDWGLKATTAAVIWGCFEFNTNDVGLTELIMRTWTA